MSDELATPTDGGGKRKRGAVLTLLKAAAFVSVIVLVEVGVATAILPTPEETRRVGEELARPDGDAPADEEAGNHEPAPDEEARPESLEVSLGTYHVVAYNPSTGTSMNIDFELFGVVLAEDETEFADRYLLVKKRLNEQVTIAIRGMQSADFTDPGLGLIKRVILEKVNRALGKTIVREAIFSEFSFVER